MSSLESDFYMVNRFGLDMQGLKVTGSTCIDFWMCDESGFGAGGRDGLRSFVWGFYKPSLIWLLCGWEVACGMCNFPGTLSGVSIGSPNVVRADEAASSSPSSPLSELARSPRLSPMAFNISWNVDSGLVVGCSAFLISAISNNPSFRLKHPGVPDCSDGSGGTSYPLTENRTPPVSQTTGRVAYIPCSSNYTRPRIPAMRRVVYYARRSSVRFPLLCVRNLVTYTHHQNHMYVTLFAGVAVMQ